jgi:serine/threonine-protein kinase
VPPQTAIGFPEDFGPYEIIELIAWVAMGAVYKARHRDTDQLVLLRVWKSPRADPFSSESWLREARRACRLTHPNLVTVFDLGLSDDTGYMAMEWLDGEPLDSPVRPGMTFTLLEQISVISQVCDALEFLHSHGILHRDVKPGNIIVLRDGKAKLLDSIPAPAGEISDTNTTALRGTVRYMAPEQISGDQPDVRADIYSLGCTLYEVVEGRLPFEGESLVAMVVKVLHDAPLPSQKAVELRLPELQQIFDKSLAKQRDSRYRSCLEFRKDLERLKMRLVTGKPEGRKSRLTVFKEWFK